MGALAVDDLTRGGGFRFSPPTPDQPSPPPRRRVRTAPPVAGFFAARVEQSHGQRQDDGEPTGMDWMAVDGDGLREDGEGGRGVSWLLHDSEGRQMQELGGGGSSSSKAEYGVAMLQVLLRPFFFCVRSTFIRIRALNVVLSF